MLLRIQRNFFAHGGLHGGHGNLQLFCSFKMSIHTATSPPTVNLGRDKYNKKLLKYKVEIEDGESELSEDEENHIHQDTEAICIFSVLPLQHVQVSDMSDSGCPRFLPSLSALFASGG